jgi:NTP pyrophosphatase (non-canonical NTP hydrolase)
MVKNMKELDELISLCKKEVGGKCPWVSELEIEEIMEGTREEIDELEVAIKRERLEEIEEELGDVIRDAFLLFFIVCKNKQLDEKEVINKVLQKVYWRKPWLKEEKKISKEEAVRIWFERKKAEKKMK